MSPNCWIFQINPESEINDEDNYTIYKFIDAIRREEQGWSVNCVSFYKQINIGDLILLRHIKTVSNKYKRWADKIVGVGSIKEIPTDIDDIFLITINKNLSTKLVENPMPCDLIREYIPNITMNRTIVPVQFIADLNFDSLLKTIETHLNIE